MITVEVQDDEMRRGFTRLVASAKNPRPVLEQIGEMLVDSTKQRFAASKGPDGAPWAKNSATTLMLWLRFKSGKYDKKGNRIGTKAGFTYAKGADKGRLAAKGVDAITSKRPLIGETGDLARQIHYVVEGQGVLAVGSTMIYGAVQQFGAKKHQFNGKAPWGDIPARPFLGISGQDSQNILDTISDYLSNSIRP